MTTVSSSTTRNGIEEFLRTLDSVQLDRFVRIMGELETLGAPAEMKALEQQLSLVKEELTVVNRARNELRLRKEEIESTIKDIDTGLLSVELQQPDLMQMKIVLRGLVSDIESRIAASRPDDLHAKKASLKREIADRQALSDLASVIGNSVVNNGR